MKIVYIAHPISGDIEGNLKKIRNIVRYVNLYYGGIVPFVPYYADIVSLNDNNPVERERGIKNDKRTLPLVHELWLFGDWRYSKGCQAEKALAESLGIIVEDKSSIDETYINGFFKQFNLSS